MEHTPGSRVDVAIAPRPLSTMLLLHHPHRNFDASTNMPYKVRQT